MNKQQWLLFSGDPGQASRLAAQAGQVPSAWWGCQQAKPSLPAAQSPQAQEAACAQDSDNLTVLGQV